MARLAREPSSRRWSGRPALAAAAVAGQQYMRDLAAASAAGGPLTPAEVGRIASRHDFTPV